MRKKIVILDKKDNVATTLIILAKGTIINIHEYDLIINIQKEIPFGHKFAIKNIEKGKSVLKYGEVIGKATQNIVKGEHVHIHNLISNRVRGKIE